MWTLRYLFHSVLPFCFPPRVAGGQGGRVSAAVAAIPAWKFAIPTARESPVAWRVIFLLAGTKISPKSLKHNRLYAKDISILEIGSFFSRVGRAGVCGGCNDLKGRPPVIHRGWSLPSCLHAGQKTLRRGVWLDSRDVMEVMSHYAREE